MWAILVGAGLTVLSGVSFAAFGWAFVINTKVNVNEATQQIRQEDLKELINEKFDGVDDKFQSIADRLQRIERAMNGKLGAH